MSAQETLPYHEAVPGAVLERLENGSLIVAADKLLQLGTYLRDHEGYDLLSSVTGVDYLGYKGRDASNRFEVVYHLYSTKRGGGPLVLKVRMPESNPELPSVVSVWPGAELQEREIWDLYGIRFTGHPNLRRILLWEGFNGHPMRKDWHEAYYEEEHKPFRSRHPNGHHVLAEDRAPWHDNVFYPEGWDPEIWQEPIVQYRLPTDPSLGTTGDLPTERIVVNFGPQHPSTHGVFRMIVTLEGETIVGLEPEVGYLHRNHEKIGERNTYLMNMPFTDRLDYLCSMSNNLGYALAVEKLIGAEVPERAEYLRIIMVELTRIINHLLAIGFLLNDLGAFFTPVLYAFEERELILDLFEEAAGSRMMCNYMRFGGVAHDVSEDWLERCRYLVNERLPRRVDELERLLTENEIVVARCKGVGYLSPEDAIALSVTGPLLRASGVQYDIRKAEPYSIYDRFDFEIPVYHGCDVYDRYRVRVAEIRQSIRILQQALKDIPPGEIQSGKKQHLLRVPPGEVYSRIEAPKGELGFYIVSDGSPNPFRYHIRAPSFVNLTALGPMSVGYKVADAIINLGSIDIVLGETDR
ncbi:MAG: NADH-quinone oxidoreductase subunit D [Anaerolineae bacterium]|nr:NADH-quinone oxidoreductase subunit D [Anaerolineae bacterium]